jgi:hypothetical protein
MSVQPNRTTLDWLPSWIGTGWSDGSGNASRGRNRAENDGCGSRPVRQLAVLQTAYGARTENWGSAGRRGSTTVMTEWQAFVAHQATAGWHGGRPDAVRRRPPDYRSDANASPKYAMRSSIYWAMMGRELPWAIFSLRATFSGNSRRIACSARIVFSWSVGTLNVPPRASFSLGLASRSMETRRWSVSSYSPENS